MTSGARVLVVDDDADMREYVTRLLAARYEVEAVDDGLAALDVAHARRPDLVLADVFIPRLDGYGLLAAIRADPALRTIPFILLSVRGDEESCVHGLEAGADDYLVKPLSPRELLARVESALRLDQARRESERRLRIAMEAGQLYTWDIDLATGDVTYSGNVEQIRGRLLGNMRETLAGVHPEDREMAARALADAAAHGDRIEHEVRATAPGGEYAWFEASGMLVRDGRGNPVRAVGITRNVTVQRQAEKMAERERLAAARDELRVALAAAEEAERRRLARELHDQLGQHLTGFALGLAEARRRIAAGESIDARLEQLEQLAQAMTRDARSLALELRPPELDDVGLESALETYVRTWGTRRGISTDVTIFGVVEDAVPSDVGSALYRITQEALTNVARHAGATQVSVILEKPDGEVQLLVEDDGCGFDLNAVAARIRSERRLGLAGMRERAALVGGTVAIESSPGVGTTLLVRVPVRTSHPFVSADGSATAESAS